MVSYVGSLKVLEKLQHSTEDVTKGSEVGFSPLNVREELGHEGVQSLHLKHLVVH